MHRARHQQLRPGLLGQLLEAGRQAGVRKVVLSSSTAVYGDCGHLPIKEEEATKLTLLDDQLALITQDDVIHRRVFDPKHRSFVPNFGTYIKAEINGKFKWFAVSRQMVLFAIERRKAWRMLQSKAGIKNKEYEAQRALLARRSG